MHGRVLTQGSELCTAVEMMLSLEKMLEITGNLEFADRLERVAYNVLPTQISDDFLTRQYYQQVKAFPRYLGSVYANCEDMDMRRLVLQNIVEEDLGEENHPELWLRFAEGLGITRESVQQAELLPETRQAVDCLKSLSRSDCCAAAMASIYAYEAMVPEVAETKMQPHLTSPAAWFRSRQ